MRLKEVGRNIENLQHECKGFLTVLELSDEEKDKINKPHSILQIKSFNAIINECKEEIRTSSIEKMSGVLRLLYNLESEPFNSNLISKSLTNFVTTQLKPTHTKSTEDDLRDMDKIVKNIDHIQKSLLSEFRRLEKKSKEFYVFNSSKRKKILNHIQSLNSLKKQIYFQMEYDSKILVKSIIDDFYNTYIFFSYIINLCFAKNQQILTIEVANAIDRYINIINYIFNERHLKSQDMLYYYLVYELNELQNSIHENILNPNL